MYVFKSSVSWSRQERIYSALVTHRPGIWKILKSSLRWSRQERTYSALVTHRLDIWKILKSSLRKSRKSDLFNLGHAPVAKMFIILKLNFILF